MKDTSKKVGYLKGLLEGMNFESDPALGKLFKGIAELLDDLTDRIETLDEVVADLNDYVESIDDDLSALEGESDDFAFNSLDEAEDYDDEDDFDIGEDHLHLLRNDSAESDEDQTLAGALCPECSRMFFVSVSDPSGSVYVCPHCSATITPVPLTPSNTPTIRPKTDKTEF